MEKQASGKPRANDRLAAIIERMAGNAASIRYGTAAVTLRIHDGRIVDITHTVTENQKEYPGPVDTGAR